jgi:hypothetical protein
MNAAGSTGPGLWWIRGTGGIIATGIISTKRITIMGSIATRIIAAGIISMSIPMIIIMNTITITMNTISMSITMGMDTIHGRRFGG